MSDFLHEMAIVSRRRTDVLEGRADALWQAAVERSPRALVGSTGLSLIAEVKLRAPSVGLLSTHGDPIATAVAQARRYADAGATAISVLTEPTRFDGALAHLEAVAQAVSVPVMRKDFLVDPLQVVEARAHGASGVLLIARMLPGERLEQMLHAAQQQGLFTLIEAFDARDLQRTAAVLSTVSADGQPATWVGVNTRDLVSLEVDPGRLERLGPQLPAGFIAVAESGLSTPADVRRAARAGYRAALIGSALMRSDDPGALMGAMRAAAEAPT